MSGWHPHRTGKVFTLCQRHAADFASALWLRYRALSLGVGLCYNEKCMRTSLLKILACPRCHHASLDLVITERDWREIQRGFLFCAACRTQFPVENGIPDLISDPPVELLREVEGWRQMLGEPSPALDDHMLQLPYLPDPLWQVQAQNFDGLLEQSVLTGKRVLDLGSGRTWSARWLEHRGAEVVAADILRIKYLGLETAELYFAADDSYFERVLSDMECLPFADASFDVVFSNASIHHSLSMQHAIKEAARVLRSGGELLLSSEPVYPDGLMPNLDDSVEVHLGINEHIYATHEWLDALRQAGLQPHLLLPRHITTAFAAGTLDEALVLRPVADYLPLLLGHPASQRLLSLQPILTRAYADYGLPLVLTARKRRSRLPLPKLAETMIGYGLAVIGSRAPERTNWLSSQQMFAAASYGLYPAEGAVLGRPCHWTGPNVTFELERPPGATMMQILLLAPPTERIITFMFNGQQRGSVRSVTDQRWFWRRVNLQIPSGIRQRFQFDMYLDAPWSPAETLGGADQRNLGVAIAGIGFLSPPVPGVSL